MKPLVNNSYRQPFCSSRQLWNFWYYFDDVEILISAADLLMTFISSGSSKYASFINWTELLDNLKILRRKAKDKSWGRWRGLARSQVYLFFQPWMTILVFLLPSKFSSKVKCVRLNFPDDLSGLGSVRCSLRMQRVIGKLIIDRTNINLLVVQPHWYFRLGEQRAWSKDRITVWQVD